MQPGLIAARPIEGIGGHVVKADEGAREIVRLMSCLLCRPTNIETAGGLVFILPRVVLCASGVSADDVDDILALLMGQSSLPSPAAGGPGS
jgi:hypothetical protein